MAKKPDAPPAFIVPPGHRKVILFPSTEASVPESEFGSLISVGGHAYTHVDEVGDVWRFQLANG